MFTNPTVAQFMTYFWRDFPYGDDCNSVTYLDIQNAQTEAASFINQSMFDNQAQYTIGFNYITAHCLVTNLRNSSQGIQGSYSWLPASKSVGSVSESFGIPNRILENPDFSMLCKTNYGAKYLSMLLPNLSGQVFTVFGGTNP